MTDSRPQIPAHKIPVVASTDDNYAEPLTVMFVSLLENTSSPERFELFVIEDRISDPKKATMIKAVEERGSKVYFLNVNNDAYANFPTKGHISAPAYYRISIPELFDESVKKVIYLDCDLLILGDLQELWDIDLEGKVLGAVENIGRNTFKQSGLRQEQYFNSGVLLIDMDRWREQDISNKVRQFKQDHPELIATNDQCAFNGVFRGDWKRLPITWNHQSGLYRMSKQKNRLKRSGELGNAVLNPKIVHFVGWSKPWYEPCYHPLDKIYLSYFKVIMKGHVQRPALPLQYKPSVYSSFKKRIRQNVWRIATPRKGYTNS